MERLIGILVIILGACLAGGALVAGLGFDLPSLAEFAKAVAFFAALVAGVVLVCIGYDIATW